MHLRGITVSVDYDDILQLTLPYNRHHFEDFMVVTAPADQRTQELCRALDVRCFVTDAFYRRGARFNKYLAIEEGLTEFGRRGWMAVMDADIFWPQRIRHDYEVGNIYTPHRYYLEEVTAAVPPEAAWSSLPLLQEGGCPGWTQIFHAEDPHLSLPWYETDWTHCGGPDSSFHQRWPAERNCRTPWRCLHLGPTWTNWCGRAAPRRDGQDVPLSQTRRDQLQHLFRARHRNRSFREEKLS